MTYATLLESEGIKSQYLVVMKPRRLVSSTWVLDSGTKYTTSFDYGECWRLIDDGVVRTKASSASVGANEWYHDPDTNLLTIDIGADPTASQIIVTYELYFGTFDAYWYRSPLDNTTRTVYFEPLVTRSPNITSSTSDSLFGFLPIYSGQLSISNATHYLQRHLYESSFSKVDVALYHYLDELTIANTKLLFTGVCGNVEYNDDTTTFSISDRSDIFDREYRHETGASFFNYTDFPNLDPAWLGRPIRRIYGIANGIIPTNVDYVNANPPTTSDNRQHVLGHFGGSLNQASVTVLASPSSTTTRTYIDSANGINVGDTMYFVSFAPPATAYIIVTSVNRTGSHYVEHDALVGALTSTYIGFRRMIGSVTINKGGNLYYPLTDRDYNSSIDFTTKTLSLAFTSSMESNLGIGVLTTSDQIFVRCYGQIELPTLGGPSFGAISDETIGLTQGVVILYDILKTTLGLTESEINTASFTSLQATVDDQLGFTIPRLSSQNMPTYKDLISEILVTLLLKIFLDNDGKWKITQTGPVGSADKIIADDEILISSFNHSINYSEIIDEVFVKYNSREISDAGTREQTFDRVNATSTIASRLHGISRQKTYESLHFLEAEAQVLADRLSYALGDRLGTVTLDTKNRFFDTLINNVITVSRSRQLGFDYDSEVANDRDYSVDQTQKSLTDISLTLNDQKGIEDNSGSW